MSYKNPRHRNRKRSHLKKLTSTTTHPSVLIQNGLEEARLTPMRMSGLCTIYGTLGIILSGAKACLLLHREVKTPDEHSTQELLSAQLTPDCEPKKHATTDSEATSPRSLQESFSLQRALGYAWCHATSSISHAL